MLYNSYNSQVGELSLDGLNLPSKSYLCDEAQALLSENITNLPINPAYSDYDSLFWPKLHMTAEICLKYHLQISRR